jgi:hypothetical protein
MITFDSETGLVAQDTAVIRQNIAQQWKDAFNVSEDTPELNTEAETPAGQLIDGQTALVAEKDSEILRMANNFNPQTATGVAQDALGKIYFLERQVAEPTLVTCQCKGLQGTIIPYGAIVQDINGNTFYNIVPSTIPASGEVSTVFRCSEYGAIEVGAEAVNKIITFIPGWDSVSNMAAGVTGRVKETQSSFEQRRAASVAKNSHGLAESVLGTIGNLTGVVACEIEQNRGDYAVTKKGVTIPPHSVYLSVYGGEQEDIGYAMHNKLNDGCGTAGNTSVTITDETNGSEQTYYYEIPQTVSTGIKVVIQRANDTPSDIETLIKNAVVRNFEGNSDYDRAKMGSTIYVSRFYQDIISVGANLTKVEIAYPKTGTYGDVAEVPLNQMPVIDADDVQVFITEV